jgi:hypothetical protein
MSVEPAPSPWPPRSGQSLPPWTTQVAVQVGNRQSWSRACAARRPGDFGADGVERYVQRGDRPAMRMLRSSTLPTDSCCYKMNRHATLHRQTKINFYRLLQGGLALRCAAAQTGGDHSHLRRSVLCSAARQAVHPQSAHNFTTNTRCCVGDCACHRLGVGDAAV